MKTQCHKEFIRVYYCPIWIGARYILSQLQLHGYHTKHVKSLQFISPWDTINLLSNTDNPIQRLFKLSYHIRHKRESLIILLFGFFISTILLFAPENFGGFGDEPLFGYSSIRRPFIQLVIGFLVILMAGTKWIRSLHRSGRCWVAKSRLSLIVGLSFLCAFILSPLALLIVIYVRIFNPGKFFKSGIQVFLNISSPYSSYLLFFSLDWPLPTVPTATCPFLFVLSLFLLGDLLTLSYTHEALSQRVRILGVTDSNATQLASSKSEKYRLIMRPSAIGITEADMSSKTFYVANQDQFTRQGGPWESQISMDQPTVTASFIGQPQSRIHGDGISSNSSSGTLPTFWRSAATDPVALDIHEQLLQIGDIIVVETGQRFPVDGIVLERTVSKMMMDSIQ